MTIAMLGGGIASLLASYEIKKKEDIDIVVYEKSSAAERGGLLRTIDFSGRKVDVGGPHIIFSNNEDILNRMLWLAPSAEKYKRNVQIAFNGTILDYPIENGIWKLPYEKRKIYVDEMLDLPGFNPSNMEEFFKYTFGNTLTKDYFIPYNQKIWKTSPSDMEITWTRTSGRLPTPNKEKLKLALNGEPQIGYEIQSNFWYPGRGIQEMYDNLLDKCLDLGVQVKYDTNIRELSSNKNVVRVNNNDNYDLVFNSIPMPIVAKWLDIKLKRLWHNPVITVTLLLRRINYNINGDNLENTQVLYVPNREIPFHRLVFVDHFQNERSSSLKGTAVMVELTGHGYFNMDNLTLMYLVSSGLAKLGLIKDSNDIEKFKVTKNYFGYPIDLFGTEDTRQTAIQTLRDKNIISIGRWGCWSYWNIDKVYLNVLERISSNLR
jgi:protoporphyrinogen oxidase